MRPGSTSSSSAAPAALAPCVAVHWPVEADADFDLRIPPDGCMNLIGDDVLGSFSCFDTPRLPAGSLSQGVGFRLAAFPELFGCPADELVDLRVPIGDVAPHFVA